MKRVMLIAGEASGDLLAAELVAALRELHPEVQCFGAGGPHMARAGVELQCDMTRHAVIGLWEAVRKYFEFRRILDELLRLAVERRPEVIVCVDFGGFNSRFAAALRQRLRGRPKETDWKPKLVQFVSPQVWASRPGRADALAKNFDLLLCILPFEKDWWAQRQPNFPVVFVGHPVVGRHAGKTPRKLAPQPPVVALMPGSRRGELSRHLPLVAEAARRIAAEVAVQFRMLVPDDAARAQAASFVERIPDCAIHVGEPAAVLGNATVALSKTGTITLECALYGVPTVTFYRTSALTYLIGRRVVKVPYLSMPNLLANEAVFPEFIQHEATPQALSQAVIELLNDPRERARREQRLREIVATLGEPGAPRRAAEAIQSLLAAG